MATLIRSALKDDPTNTSEGFTLDGDAYTLSLGRVGSDTRLDLSRLPSLDYAIYLVNTVKFHLGGILRLFDEEEFLRNLHEFYSKGPEKAGTHRLWYTQCLLLLALGKGFLNVRHSPDNTSSVDFFLRAMAILPDTIVLHDEPVLAAEVLATIALYFYCLDMRHSAYSYVSTERGFVGASALNNLPIDRPSITTCVGGRATCGSSSRSIRREVRRKVPKCVVDSLHLGSHIVFCRRSAGICSR